MTGLRQSELLGLRWRDVDWAAQRIRVRNTFVRGEHSTDGKSDLSTRRSVPMADRLAGELDRWSQRTEYKRRWRSRIRTSPDRVATRPLEGHQALQGGVPRRWCARGQVPRPAPHFRDPSRGLGAATAHDPGVPRPRRQQDDADIRPLRAVGARGADGQRGVRDRKQGSGQWGGHIARRDAALRSNLEINICISMVLYAFLMQHHTKKNVYSCM